MNPNFFYKYINGKMKNNEGEERYVPKFRVRSSKHTWYNATMLDAQK